jgi:OOP family OmpA-OmpF porin
MSNTKPLLAIVALLFVLGDRSVYAVDQSFYMGGGGGQSRAKNPATCSDLQAIFDPSFGAGSPFSCNSNDTSTGWKLFAGYQITPNLAAEVGYVDLGNFKVSASGSVNLLQATASGSDKANGISLDAVGTLPINQEFGLIGRIGIFAWRLDATAIVSAQGAPGGPVSTEDKPTGTSLDFGAGVKYDLNKNFGVRAEYQRFQSIGNSNTGKSDVDLFSASVLYRFR